jgi:hypothetical protein
VCHLKTESKGMPFPPRYITWTLQSSSYAQESRFTQDLLFKKLPARYPNISKTQDSYLRCSSHGGNRSNRQYFLLLSYWHRMCNFVLPFCRDIIFTRVEAGLRGRATYPPPPPHKLSFSIHLSMVWDILYISICRSRTVN